MKTQRTALLPALLIVVCADACADTHEREQPGGHTDRDDHDDHRGEQSQGGNQGDLAGPLGLVHLSPAAIERSGIAVGKVQQGSVQGGIDAPAEIQLNPDRTAHITPLLPGQLVEVRARLGDRVAEKQVIATLKSVALGEARAAASRAKAEAEVASANFKRQQELQQGGIGSKRAYVEAHGQLRQAEAELASALERLNVYGGEGGQGSLAVIRSPFVGTIIQRHATVGEVVSSERPLFVVADLSEVWVVGQVYEPDIAAVQLGAPATVRLQAYGGRTWKGKIGYVASTLDPNTRTLAIRVELENKEGLLRPGLFGSISVTPVGGPQKRAVVVPEKAIQRFKGKAVVFVPGPGAGVFRAVPVETGVRAQGKVEILRGVQEGDEVVVSGAFTLKSQALRGEMADGHHH